MFFELISTTFCRRFWPRPPERTLIEHTRALDGDISEMGQAASNLARIAARSAEPSLTREFNRLFVGLGRGELLPYASYYMTGFLNERPLAALRAEMRRLGVTRAENVFEPEDNIATLCEIMAGLIRGRFGPPATLDMQTRLLRPPSWPVGGAFLYRSGGRQGLALLCARRNDGPGLHVH